MHTSTQLLLSAYHFCTGRYCSNLDKSAVTDSRSPPISRPMQLFPSCRRDMLESRYPVIMLVAQGRMGVVEANAHLEASASTSDEGIG